MSLQSLTILEEYRSDRGNLVYSFYLPCLEQATVYSRAVGFFSSSSLITVAKGLTALIRVGGKMRLIASPYLTPEDVEAIGKGLKEREDAIAQAIVQELDREFEAIARDRLACLAWLLGQGFLEIKLAVPRNLGKSGIYHEKLGVFADGEDNLIAFTGSANESYSAWTENFECLDVFCSWKEKEKERSQRKNRHFQQLWDNRTANVEVLNFPEAAAKSLLRFRPPFPPTQEPTSEFSPGNRLAEPKSRYRVNLPSKPSVKVNLRPLQQEALAAWSDANYCGILAMATGTGKTITALAGATRLDHLDLVVIAAPTKEIVQQWVQELDYRTTFPFPVVAVGKSQQWREKLFRKLRLLNHQQLSQERLPAIVIGIYSELSKSPVMTLIEDAGGLPEKSLLIADEVHAAGAEISRSILRDDFRYRLGLSATPIRPYDEEGTELVLDYFGGIVYEFGLKDAIAAGILCEYDYYVYVTILTEREHERFQQLTLRLSRLLNSKDEEDHIQAQKIAIQRARIVKSATSKLAILDRIIRDHPLEKGMIYCADIAQATEISRNLSQQGFRVARYTSEDSNRQQLLSQFSRGDLQGLVAVKCLDEGVDIPAVSQGIILASDASERQFIQRRGRILRFASAKKVATLIDVVVVPPLLDQGVKLIESEIRRVKQFANSARNRSTAITELVEELRHYGITYSDLV